MNGGLMFGSTMLSAMFFGFAIIAGIMTMLMPFFVYRIMKDMKAIRYYIEKQSYARDRERRKQSEERRKDRSYKQKERVMTQKISTGNAGETTKENMKKYLFNDTEIK
ncbi:hypothetical protein [Desulfogranum marinum]|uniref:hypothetical protein n=1 Tax=Desulfogranum marinum TaxID=453220 RepID=UPI0029C8E165|nr:hypothetical protein [Desulfogranum marinum]